MLYTVGDLPIKKEGKNSIYTDAIYRLFVSVADGKTLLGAKAVYEGLENCCDLCEHAADVIEQINIKNT